MALHVLFSYLRATNGTGGENGDLAIACIFVVLSLHFALRGEMAEGVHSKVCDRETESGRGKGERGLLVLARKREIGERENIFCICFCL